MPRLIMKYLKIYSFVTISLTIGFCTSLDAVQIDSDYPGGNIIVEKIDGNDVYLQQYLLDTELAESAINRFRNSAQKQTDTIYLFLLFKKYFLKDSPSDM